MLFKNVNPTLNSDLLAKAGFNFDGYYYVNPSCPVRLNKVEAGYAISFIDPNGPPIEDTISNYCDLIALMMKTVQQVIQVQSVGKTFANTQEQVQFIADVVKKYFKFDKHINLVILHSPMGLQIIPNNEYTYTVINGDIRNFKVYYEWQSGEVVSKNSIELEISAQCISWPFLMTFITKSLEGFNKESDKLTITGVYMINEGAEIPFYGMGIPTVHQNQEG
jgi:hypothetical protein